MVLIKKWLLLLFFIINFFISAQEYIIRDLFEVSPVYILSQTGNGNAIKLLSETVELRGTMIRSVLVLKNMDENEVYTGKLVCMPLSYLLQGTGTPIPEDFNLKLNGKEISFTIENDNKIISKDMYHPGGYLKQSVIYFKLVLPHNSDCVLEIFYKNQILSKDYFGIGVACSISTHLADSETKYTLIYEAIIPKYILTGIGFIKADETISLFPYLKTARNLENAPFFLIKESANKWQLKFKNEYIRQFEQIKIGMRSDEFIDSSPLALICDESFSVMYFQENISQRLLNKYECVFFTTDQLRILRNAYYAAHRYPFQSKDMNAFFNSVYQSHGSSYIPNPNFSESMLNEIERENIETIKRLENMKLPAVIE